MLPTRLSFADYAAQWGPTIESALDGYTQLGDGCPTRLRESIRYSLLAPAKRLRPLLVLSAAEACGGSIEEAMPAACAVEMIHTYSLIHDDLPAMDDDDLRRGRPTNHVVYGDGLAILAGDALLTLAFEVLSRDIQPPSVAARCCAVLAEAAGACQLVGGQTDDLAEDKPQTLETLEAIHRRKTGAMFLAPLQLGALTADASAEQHAALREYGECLGLAFQIVDDLLDVQGNEATLGKRVGKDVAHGKLTFPGLLGIEESRRRASQLTARACAAVAPWLPAAEGLDALARFVAERDR